MILLTLKDLWRMPSRYPRGVACVPIALEQVAPATALEMGPQFVGQGRQDGLPVAGGHKTSLSRRQTWGVIAVGTGARPGREGFRGGPSWIRLYVSRGGLNV